MSRGYIGRESDGLGRGTYTLPVPLLVERRGSHASGMNDPLEVKVCEKWEPINQLENPSFELYKAMRKNLQLYTQAITDGNREVVGNMKKVFNSTFKKVKSKMGNKYGESFFNILQDIYNKLSESRESSSEIVAIMERI